MELILLIVLVLLLVGGLPNWSHSSGWGYGPSGIIGVILIIFLLFWLFGGGFSGRLG